MLLQRTWSGEYCQFSVRELSTLKSGLQKQRKVLTYPCIDSISHPKPTVNQYNAAGLMGTVSGGSCSFNRQLLTNALIGQVDRAVAQGVWSLFSGCIRNPIRVLTGEETPNLSSPDTGVGETVPFCPSPYFLHLTCQTGREVGA